MKPTFSAFWPLTILFVTLIALQASSLSQAFEQRSQIEQNIKTLSEKEKQISQIDTVLGAVSKDLLQLAVSNPVAKQLVGEFQIRQNAETPAAPAEDK